MGQTSIETETTLSPGSGLEVLVPLVPSQIEACAGALSWARGPLVDGCAILPSGFACEAPAAGSVITVPMDCGWLVHVERVDGEAFVSVEPPASVPPPAGDDELAQLVLASRGGDDEARRSLEEAFRYRCTFERLAEPWPGDGGPIVPTRWITLSWEDRVSVPGIGVVDLGAAAVAADGRRVFVRRVQPGESAPAGAVEVVVQPAVVIHTSARCVRLDD